MTSFKTVNPLSCPKKLSKTQTPNSFMSLISVLHISSNPNCSAISLKYKNKLNYFFFVKNNLKEKKIYLKFKFGPPVGLIILTSPMLIVFPVKFLN